MKYLNINLEDAPNGSILAHGVNTQGVMGAGVARALRNRFTGLYAEYCDYIDDLWDRGVPPHRLLGTVFWYWTEEGNFVIANCFTQENFGSDGKRYASPLAIGTALRAVFEESEEIKRPIYMPQIGCGLGGLDWHRDVSPIISGLEELFGFEVNICLGKQ